MEKCYYTMLETSGIDPCIYVTNNCLEEDTLGLYNEFFCISNGKIYTSLYIVVLVFYSFLILKTTAEGYLTPAIE